MAMGPGELELFPHEPPSLCVCVYVSTLRIRAYKHSIFENLSTHTAARAPPPERRRTALCRCADWGKLWICALRSARHTVLV